MPSKEKSHALTVMLSKSLCFYVSDEHYKTLGDDGVTNLYFMYKVSGSQLYLAVSANHVFSEVMTGQPEQDKTSE